ncbi:7209_t:CDS:2 [Ambispora gerdemannii]|uniref:Man(5)GlcNAc(2)-PP-dolichol translocation protein RFT1 n=1 Tax=Ambispora gerdemannii TaxID=144530 RepID=A0A9N8V1U9_9GLOM|nr:7209_t:CDS:2 [Ambispora gerdemannii]
MSETRQRKYPERQEKNITKDNINNVDKQNVETFATSQLQNILSTSVKGASYLILLQLLSRLLTFILHQIVLRFTNPKTFGIAAVQLELLLNTILFLSREGFRCALLRGSGIENVQRQEKPQETKNEALKYSKQFDNLPLANSQKGKAQKIINLSFIPIPFGILTTSLACLFCIHTASDETFNSPYYVESVILYGLAAFLELTIEPLFITATSNLMFMLRVRSEGIGVIVRCVITLALTILGAQHDNNTENTYGILAFAFAQFAYALIIFCGYIGYFYWNWNWSELWPRPVIVIQNGRQQKVWFDHDLSRLAYVFTGQSFLKHILTEGDKMLITWLSTPKDQGVYAFVVNYGSLVVRILFQPLEETGRTLFSKLLSSIQPLKKDDVDEKVIESEKAEIQKELLLTSLKILTTLIKLHILLGLLFIAIGSNYTGTLIDILVGKKWSTGTSAPMALSFYCFYVPIMGINGITEAFVAAVATKETISLLNYWMIFFSIGFIGAGFVFMRILLAGAVGLIAANAFNLFMRILWSWRFIRSYYLSNVNFVTAAEVSHLKNEIDHLLSLSNMTPSFVVWLSFAVAWFGTFWSNQVIGWTTLDAKIKHIGVGVIIKNDNFSEMS